MKRLQITAIIVAVVLVVAFVLYLVVRDPGVKAETSTMRQDVRELKNDAVDGVRDAYDTTKDAVEEGYDKTKDAVKDAVK